MTILFILYMCLVPLLMGMFVMKIVDFKGQNMADNYLCGFLTLVVMSGIVQLVTTMLNYSFAWYCKALLIVSCFMALVGILVTSILQSFSVKEFRRGIREKERAINRKGIAFGIFLILVIFVSVLARILFSVSSLEGDLTLETINTSIATNTIYKYNSFTGALIEGGMPIRQKILTLPFLLGFFAHIFELDIPILVLRIYPCFVALMCFLAFHRMATYFFPDSIEKRITFTGIFGFMVLVGDYSSSSPAYLLIYRGFGGYALLTCVILPFLFVACLRRKWGIAALCLAAEVFTVWTTYGVGFGVMTVVIFIISFFFKNIIRSTPAKTKEQSGKV